jgi:hypothetical protein
MSIADKIIRLNNDNIDEDRNSLKFGLCSHSDRCYLYFEHDYHCNQNRGLFLINGSTIPSCYQKKREE